MLSNTFYVYTQNILNYLQALEKIYITDTKIKLDD